MVGQTISHYRILSKLGEGGMGVVYKAEDTNLGRTVALKFLAAHLLKDEEARKRFNREARAAAALNHPNVCTVHEIGEADGRTFIVMEFVEGESLDKRIEQGPLKITEALGIAQQIAKALETAHTKKIVHRDIKPGNVIVDAKAHVTVMDFGLALLTEGSKLTDLDTTAYMSPEQIQGLEVDHRTDIWAAGCVIYELVCGQRSFKGLYDKALLYEIVQEEYEPITGVRAGVPMELEFIAGKCLAKPPGQRYQTTAELVVDLETLWEKLKSGKSAVRRADVAVGDEGARHVAPVQRSHGVGVQTGRASQQTKSPAVASNEVVPKQNHRMLQALLGGAIIAFLALAFIHFGETPPEAPEAPVRRFSFAPESLLTAANRVRISPNGKHIVYIVRRGEERGLWVRELDREEPRELDGTEGAERPFWSPDSRWIGFAAGGELKKVPAGGGRAIILCALPGPFYLGGTWNPDGSNVVFSSGTAGLSILHAVSDRGGEPSPLFDPEESGGLGQPHLLPSRDGAPGIVFSAGVGAFTNGRIFVRNLETGESQVLAEGRRPIYSPTGHIVYETSEPSGVWALPFSLETLTTAGAAFPIVRNAGEPSVAEDGTLVYVDDLPFGLSQLVWRGRDGIRQDTIGRPQQLIRMPALSPDGRRVAVSAFENGSFDIWVHDVTRPIKTRISLDVAAEFRPAWSPSGSRISFDSDRSGNSDIFIMNANGSGDVTPFAATPRDEFASDWHPDGKRLIYHVRDPETLRDIWYADRREDNSSSEPVPFLETPFQQQTAKFSPDGRYVAYISRETGQREIFVRAFPDGEEKWQISDNGGVQPRWRRDGKELYYVQPTPRRTLVAVSVTLTPSFSVGSAARLFEHLLFRNIIAPNYDVSADGHRFVTVERLEDTEPRQPPKIHVVENWYEEFRGRKQE